MLNWSTEVEVHGDMTSNSNGEDANRVSIHVVQQRGLVWNVDDITRIRSDHGICGLLSGTLPQHAQQNVFLGVPLVLLPEEVVYLVEKEAAVLVDDPHAYPEPTLEQLNSWIADRDEDIAQQWSIKDAKSKAAKRKQEGTGGHAMTEAAIKKRKEREEKRAKERLAKGLTEILDTEPSPISESLPRETPEQQRSSQTQQQWMVTVPVSSSSMSWYSSAAVSYETIQSAREAGVWVYPNTLKERARCAVFRDLRQQGYFLGIGIRFGADYLVYPGDPLRYHSHFAATVHESPAAELRPMEIVAHGRLGTATKKAHLLCGYDDESKEVSYLSIEWAGFG